MLNQKRTHLTVEERGKIIDLAAYALPVVDIARILRRSTSVVYQTLQDLGVSAKAPERTDDQIATARQQATILTPPEQAFTEAHPNVPRHPSVETHERLAEDKARRMMQSAGTDISSSNAYSTFLCADCGEAYSMTAEHLGWFYERNLNPPKRCEQCREERRGTHDYDAGKDAANVAQAKLEKQVLAQLKDLHGRTDAAIEQLEDVLDIIDAVSLMFAPDDSKVPVAKGYTDLEYIDLDHDLGVRDQRGPFGEEV